jgi:hypothetical protein
MLLQIALKDTSVKINFTPETARAVVIVYNVMREHGIPFLITSGNDGTHKAHSPRHPRSLHYEDRAFDFRLPSRYSGWVSTDLSMYETLRAALGPDYDVVLEGDHFHVEHDPKPVVLPAA